ncbi:tRNA-specific adenosine deaminase subunit TAD2 [Colletotrichum chlorophyti]|uniref:tRNA-specific adenosine deaminase subunit TAD2 n=1 Tax=Colletotrichum chlorophyti TaxID=708187 RepID=A0A1Q8RP66_9PEZI|nr:tRNA-specific adenosine deaminase subunit TAD2 [Colletotrichum chlorophyti]
MAGTEGDAGAPAIPAATMKAPRSTSDPLSDASGSRRISQGKKRENGNGKERRSTTKFLQNIFYRLLPPFSPNSKSSSTTANIPSSQPTTNTTSPRSQLPYQPESQPGSPENSEMASVPLRPAISRGKDGGSGIPASPSRTATFNSDHNKENGSPALASMPPASVPPAAAAPNKLSLEDSTARPRSSTPISKDVRTSADEKPAHQTFMDQALDMARLALRTNETPVGCVLVHNGTVIARGMNATNVTRNGTRHAEFMALSALLSYRPGNDDEGVEAQLRQQAQERSKADVPDDESDLFPLDDDYVRKGHLYPYGQKLHRAPRFDRAIVRECILYVTVEPCVMCAGLLRQLGIKKVYFGAVNDKFGGTGGVFSIHKNSTDTRQDPNPIGVLRPLQASTNTLNAARPSSSSSSKSSLINTTTANNNHRQQTLLRGGDGGNVEPGFEAEGGWGRDEAVSLLRRFYVQENGRAPVPRKKEGRAARLAAIEAAGSEGAALVPPVSSEIQAHTSAANEVIAVSDDPSNDALTESKTPTLPILIKDST